ncbi:hypothetical protein EO087_14220 [Dyella sp. M7H15-1]|uniref:hypothetical protein n=1 Tax=Dyella sp. M7H15-1 TaxID=2501295 RepID=UPI0010051A2E|nr:hypothetical protein [Dyella sp. M7H15-1]QAU25009.1 hypothetical protein EO087_14220 [Dyella sp. M7H15-1]
MTTPTTSLSASTPPPAPTPPIPANIAYTVKYQAGMFLTAENMTTAQNYLVNWMQLQNQMLYTPGVLNGLAVSSAGPASLAVQPGTGFDDNGCFLILPGDSAQALALPSGATDQVYKVYLVYPDPNNPPPVQGTSDTEVNMASGLQVLDDGASAPGRSVVLAQVTVKSGVIDGVTDLRAPVASRLPANLGGTADINAMAPKGSSQSMLRGVASVPSTDLRQPGKSVEQPVYFNPPPGSEWKRIPQVMVTVLGSVPYATAVSGVDTEKFTLTLTSLFSLAAENTGPITVQWLAYV